MKEIIPSRDWDGGGRSSKEEKNERKEGPVLAQRIWRLSCTPGFSPYTARITGVSKCGRSGLRRRRKKNPRWCPAADYRVCYSKFQQTSTSPMKRWRRWASVAISTNQAMCPILTSSISFYMWRHLTMAVKCINARESLPDQESRGAESDLVFRFFDSVP